MRTLIASSILSADFSRMGDDVKRMENAGADWIHCDVMDGVFVKNISFGPKLVGDIRRVTKLPLDVHLMITEPERYVDNFIHAGADYLTVHFEATKVLKETLLHIKSKSVVPGVVISPDTPVSALKGFLKDCGIVLLMSVYPGFGGQGFIPESIDRLKELTALAKSENSNILIEIDGGVTLENAPAIRQAGAEILVAGNTVFSAKDTAATIKALRG